MSSFENPLLHTSKKNYSGFSQKTKVKIPYMCKMETITKSVLPKSNIGIEIILYTFFLNTYKDMFMFLVCSCDNRIFRVSHGTI